MPRNVSGTLASQLRHHLASAPGYPNVLTTFTPRPKAGDLQLESAIVGASCPLFHAASALVVALLAASAANHASASGAVSNSASNDTLLGVTPSKKNRLRARKMTTRSRCPTMTPLTTLSVSPAAPPAPRPPRFRQTENPTQAQAAINTTTPNSVMKRLPLGSSEAGSLAAPAAARAVPVATPNAAAVAMKWVTNGFTQRLNKEPPKSAPLQPTNRFSSVMKCLCCQPSRVRSQPKRHASLRLAELTSARRWSLWFSRRCTRQWQPSTGQPVH